MQTMAEQYAKDARDFQLSNAGIYSWWKDLEAKGKKAALDDRNVLKELKDKLKFTQVASRSCCVPQFINEYLKLI